MADHQTGIRLPSTALARADALADALRDDPEVSAMGPVTRSGVLRLAIALGLDELERRRHAPDDRPELLRRLPDGRLQRVDDGRVWAEPAIRVGPHVVRFEAGTLAARIVGASGADLDRLVASIVASPRHGGESDHDLRIRALTAAGSDDMPRPAPPTSAHRTITLTAQPVPGDSLDLDGVRFVFGDGVRPVPPGLFEVRIGDTIEETAENLDLVLPAGWAVAVVEWVLTKAPTVEGP